MAKGDQITASAINTMIGKINTEKTRRALGSPVSNVSLGNLIYASEFNAWRTANIGINAVHCYCQGDGTIETHSGGTTLSLTASAVSAGNNILWDDINERDNDIDSLAAQCAQVVCTCQTNINCLNQCACLGLKPIVYCGDCGCNINCTCDDHCTCEFN